MGVTLGNRIWMRGGSYEDLRLVYVLPWPEWFPGKAHWSWRLGKRDELGEVLQGKICVFCKRQRLGERKAVGDREGVDPNGREGKI